MSRSHHGSRCGRGCWVCGDAGEVRRKREAEAQRVDEREQDSLAPADERKLYDQRPESELYDRRPDPESGRRGGRGPW